MDLTWWYIGAMFIGGMLPITIAGEMDLIRKELKRKRIIEEYLSIIKQLAMGVKHVE